jgi:ribosomal protein L11 methyltransferase
MAWAEISCDVPDTMVDALSEFLMQYASSGVVVENRSVDTFSLDTLDESPVKTVTCYLPDDETLSVALAALAGFLHESEGTFCDYTFKEPRISTVREDDWANSWKVHFKPARIGKRFVIKPTWENVTPAAGDIVLELDPGMAFGTGTHPTTKMCLEWLESIVFGEPPFDRPPRRQAPTVLDVGTGSGILALAAVKLGAARVEAIDIDPQAVTVAEQNLALNGAQQGVCISTTPLEAISGVFDIVLANILAEELVRLREQLVRRVVPGGHLVLSGILTEREQFVIDGFSDTGMQLAGSSREAEWSCLCYQMPD